MITGAYKFFGENSLRCLTTAAKTYNSPIEENTDSDEDSDIEEGSVKEQKNTCVNCLTNFVVKELGSRLLYLAQVVASVATLALNLVVGTLASLLAICIDGPEPAWKLFKDACMIEWLHYATLPASIAGIFLPQYGNPFDL